MRQQQPSHSQDTSTADKMEENNPSRDKGLKRKHPGDQERMRGGRGGGRGAGQRGGSGRVGGERDGVGRGGVKRSGDKERNRQVGNGDAEGKRGGTGEGGAKKRLDPLSVGYFRRVGERLIEGFTEDEERVLFVDNVLAEVKGQAALVAMDVTGSVTLQRLLPLASLSQVGEVMAELGGESGSALKTVSCDKCGGHVVESALRQMSRWREKSSLDNGSTTTEGEEEECGALEPQVLSLCRVVKDHCAEFIRHTHGSHVARTLIHILAGCLGPARSETARPGVKDKNVPTQLTYFEVPTSFWWELKHLSTSLIENVNVCVTDPVASAVLQNMLTVCHRGRPKLCKQLNRGIVGYLTSLSSAPGVSPLLVFLKDAASSRLIETVIQLSHKALLRDLYKNHFKGQLVTLAIHPIANFPIQRLTAASTSYKMNRQAFFTPFNRQSRTLFGVISIRIIPIRMDILLGSITIHPVFKLYRSLKNNELQNFLKVFDELTEGLEAILAAGHMGVIVQLTDSCAEWEEKQGEMMQRLLRAFHCAEPASRHTACLPLFLSLLTHEVYYCPKTTEGDTQSERPLSSICYHGSRLVQSLAKFKDRSLLLNSLRSMTPADHLTLGTDQTGSHVLQLLVTSSSDKGRGKILRRLEGQYVQMACSRYGSRVLEAIWTSATVPQRKSIAKELVSCEKQLRSDQFARHIWAKFALTHFVKRQAQWQEVQMGESKKRKLFSDILD